ncbi:TrkH family potassium uptake protein [candidate division KSB1 bacterium]|nr:TrkH family potassium uptake protein [candidate division KSB1 bacterium]
MNFIGEFFISLRDHKLFFISATVIEWRDQALKWFRLHIIRNPARMLVISFMALIGAGTAGLMLPQSSAGEPIRFIDALFTSTSASCVTGLAVFDVGSQLTRFGQIVLLLLIQLGGLGIVTFSTFFILIVGGSISFRGHNILQETFSQQPMADFGALVKSIILVTLGIELVGATLLYFSFRPLYPPDEAVYYSIFHSISAFCNAGFSLYPDSFIRFQADWYFNLIICALIICGGLGFVVYYDLGDFIFRRSRRPLAALSFHTRLTVMVTGLLVIGGAAGFFLFESPNALKPLDWPAQILVSLFQSVTPRTAGFNTIPFDQLTNGTLFFVIWLMFVGGCSGSCAGGIKTSTFAVLIGLGWARFRDQQEVNLLKRRIPESVVSKAVSVTLFAMSVIVCFAFVLLASEIGGVSHQLSRWSFIDILFETTSAFGTVGLSTGVTTTLSDLGRLAITLVMFLGRVGPLTVAIAVTKSVSRRYKYASETFLVG